VVSSEFAVSSAAKKVIPRRITRGKDTHNVSTMRRLMLGIFTLQTVYLLTAVEQAVAVLAVAAEKLE
jgi:hypothetical protein